MYFEETYRNTFGGQPSSKSYAPFRLCPPWSWVALPPNICQISSNLKFMMNWRKWSQIELSVQTKWDGQSCKSPYFRGNLPFCPRYGPLLVNYDTSPSNREIQNLKVGGKPCMIRESGLAQVSKPVEKINKTTRLRLPHFRIWKLKILLSLKLWIRRFHCRLLFDPRHKFFISAFVFPRRPLKRDRFEIPLSVSNHPKNVSIWW